MNITELTSLHTQGIETAPVNLLTITLNPSEMLSPAYVQNRQGRLRKLSLAIFTQFPFMKIMLINKDNKNSNIKKITLKS